MRAAFLLLVLAGCGTPQPAPPVLTPEQRATMKELAFKSAREGDAETLSECLDAGQDVNEANARGDTLLTVAAYNGQAGVVELLLARRGVAVDVRNKMGLTALSAAAFKGRADIARTLLDAGADANAASPAGQTALMFAALAGKVDVVEVLLAAGASPAAADKKGNTARGIAETQGADDVVRLLDAAK